MQSQAFTATERSMTVVVSDDGDDNEQRERS